MNKLIRRAAMAALVSAASATAVTALMPANAAVPQPKGRAGAAQNAGPQVRPPIGKPLNDAMKMVDMKDFVGALAKIKEADSAMEKTPIQDYIVREYLT